MNIGRGGMGKGPCVNVSADDAFYNFEVNQNGNGDHVTLSSKLGFLTPCSNRVNAGLINRHCNCFSAPTYFDIWLRRWQHLESLARCSNPERSGRLVISGKVKGTARNGLKIVLSRY